MQQIGSFTLDPANAQMFRDGREFRPRPKAWQVLLYLADRRDRLVTGKELLDQVWVGTAVTPKTLTNVINELRRLLAADPSVRIETHHRRGYRLVVDTAAAPAAAPPLTRLGEVPFVARAAERRQLAACWRAAVGGRHQVSLVSGFAGIGKTSLINALLADLRGTESAANASVSEPLILRGACTDQALDPEPYGPVVEAFDGAACAIDILPLLQRYAPNWLARMPWLLPADEMNALRMSLLGVGTSRSLREAVHLIEAIAAVRPTLLVLEDLHWADDATLALLTALVHAAPSGRWMVLASYRPGGRDSPLRVWLDRIARSPCVSRTTLEPFTATDIRSYLNRRLGDAVLARQLEPLFESKSGGNPLFLREIVDVLIDRGWLAQSTDGWHLTVELGVIEQWVPVGVRATIGQHVGELDAAASEVLSAASIVGVRFVDKVVAAACQRTQEETSAICQRLADHGQFIELIGLQQMPDGLPWNVYRFRHDILRQGISELLTPAEQRGYHTRIATMLEQEYAQYLPDVAPRLARHHAATGCWERQLEFLDVVVMDALMSCSYREALAALEQANLVFERHTAAGGTAEISPLLAEQQAGRYQMCGNLAAFLLGSSNPRAQASFERALALADRHGSFLLRFRALNGCGSTALLRGLPIARDNAAALVALAEDGHPEALATAYLTAALAELRLGDGRVALHHAQRAHQALPQASSAITMMMNVPALVECTLSCALRLAGDSAGADAHRDAALAAIAAWATPYDRAILLGNLAQYAMFADDPASALELGESAIAVADEFGFEFLPTAAAGCTAWARCRLGQISATEYQVEIERLSAANGWDQELLWIYLAAAYVREGNLPQAEQALAQVQGHTMAQVEQWLVQGDLELAHGRQSEARRYYRQALDAAQRQGAGLLERRANERVASVDEIDEHSQPASNP